MANRISFLWLTLAAFFFPQAGFIFSFSRPTISNFMRQIPKKLKDVSLYTFTETDIQWQTEGPIMMSFTMSVRCLPKCSCSTSYETWSLKWYNPLFFTLIVKMGEKQYHQKQLLTSLGMLMVLLVITEPGCSGSSGFLHCQGACFSHLSWQLYPHSLHFKPKGEK